MNPVTHEIGVIILLELVLVVTDEVFLNIKLMGKLEK